MTPFQALYGRLSPSIPFYRPGATSVHEVDRTLIDRNDILNELKANIMVAQSWMKQQADLGRRDIAYDVGGWVYLKLQSYRQHLVFCRA
ncbi:hypothetical protein LINGRAHAP2_LOCUS23400 [Linum grandiflorum]